MKRARSFASATLLAGLAACSSTESTTPGTTTTTTTSTTTSTTAEKSPLGERPDLPIDERITIENLEGPVDVVRDKYGRPHIYATSVNDAMRVEGYYAALDRGVQLEFYRRYSEGRLAEILSDTSADAIDNDIVFRHIGLGRTAKAQYDALPKGELRDAMLAYADGISQVFAKIRSGDIHIPPGVLGIAKEAFTAWTPVDSLAIGRLQTYLLSYDADSDISTQAFFDAARSAFPAADPDPQLAKRAGLERDLFRFAPADPATTTTGYPTLGPTSHKARLPRARDVASKARDKKTSKALSTVAGYLAAMGNVRRDLTRTGFGSNNWAVSKERSATGHVLLASDPHLSLSAPSVFWPVSIEVKTADPANDLVVAGLSFPGIPGIILGHNQYIAWGATVAGYDVSDAFEETLTADGKSVVWNGGEVAIQTVEEIIQVQSGSPVKYEVQIVPHHGPLVPNVVNHQVVPADPAKGAISIRWTGMEATREIEAVFDLLRSKDVDAARKSLKLFGVGAQNWMIGDTKGHIAWTSHANVPIRDPRAFAWDAKTYRGTLPCLVLPGDGTADWTSTLDDDLVPWAKDPAAGYISTANNDPIGDTLDNDPSNDTLPDGTPMYLACSYDLGFREGKIHRRIEDHKEPLTPEDLSAIQGDEQSSMGKALTPALLTALERGFVEKQMPGKYPDLSEIVKDPGWDTTKLNLVRALLKDWGEGDAYLASSGVSHDDNTPLPEEGNSAVEVKNSKATLIFNAWMVRLMSRTLGDELTKMGRGLGHQNKAKAMIRLVSADPASLATFDPATGDSSLWDDLDTPAVETRHERMLRALLDALSDLGPDVGAYRWGAHHTVRFGALLPFWGLLSIPPTNDSVFLNGFPRHGDSYSIDASEFSFVGAGKPFDFSYDAGPTQRFVIDLDPRGPKAVNALPGGVIWNAQSPHFRDEAELWRRNQTHPVPFLLDDVIAAKERRTLVTP